MALPILGSFGFAILRSRGRGEGKPCAYPSECLFSLSPSVSVLWMITLSDYAQVKLLFSDMASKLTS